MCIVLWGDTACAAGASINPKCKYNPKIFFAGNAWNIPLSEEPFWFTAGAFNIKIYVPPAWQNHVEMVDMRLTTGALLKSAYGFVLNSSHVTVEAEQYLGVLVIYDSALWHNRERLTSETLLMDDDKYVYVYVNSMFNQFPNLRQARLFNKLALNGGAVLDCIRIEKTGLAE